MHSPAVTSAACCCAGQATKHVKTEHAQKLPVGVLVAIVVAIALVIGSLILTVGIVCLKRYAVVTS